jgi:hypothetical protein
MVKSENENVWFPHYVSARNDRKVRRLRRELNVEGYGIYFMLLEVLREQSDLKYPMEDLDLLAEEFGTSEQKIRVVICNYSLFEVDETENFFSPKQILYLQPYFAKSKRAKHAALVRWRGTDANAYANALPEHSASNTNAMQEEKRREEKSRVENARTLDFPTIEQCKSVAEMEGHNKSFGERYFAMRDSHGWCVPRGNSGQLYPITNWRSDYLNCYNKGYLNTPTNKPEQQKIVDGGVFQ